MDILGSVRAVLDPPLFDCLMLIGSYSSRPPIGLAVGCVPWNGQSHESVESGKEARGPNVPETAE